MNDFWLKLKAWTKLIAFSLIALYVLIFLFLNRNATIEPELHLVFKIYVKPNVLVVLFMTSLLSVITWWLIRTAFTLFHEIRILQHQSRATQLERELADMKSKAAMLNTRPATEPAERGFDPIPVAPEPPPADVNKPTE